MTNSMNTVGLLAVGSFYDGRFVELFVAHAAGSKGLLRSTEFYEHRPDLGEVRELKSVDWDVVVPDRAALFVPSSGQLRNQLKAFWLAWQEGDRLHAQSIFHEQPIVATVAADDRFAPGPVILPDGRLHQYFWREQTLMRHDFSGPVSAPGAVETVQLFKVQQTVLLSAAAPIPNATENSCVVVWIEQTDAGCKFVFAKLTGATVAIVGSAVATDVLPFEQQTMALHSDGKGRLFASALCISKVRRARMIVRATCQPLIPQARIASTVLPALRSLIPSDVGAVHSAHGVFTKALANPEWCHHILSQDGSLFQSTKAETRLLRHGVSLDHNFPILATKGMVFEAVYRQDGNVELRALL